jgi:hypothetical protein
MDTSAVRTLDQIVEEILLLTEYPEKYYVRVKQLLIKGYRELNITTIPEGVKISKFTMDANYIIYLNDDIITVNAVYVPMDGKLWSLTKTDKIIPTTSELDGAEFRDSTDGEGVDVELNEGTYLSGTGGNNLKGYWYYDIPNRRVLFTNVSRSEVLLNYTTGGISLTETTYIPTYTVDALEHYVLWKLSMFNSIQNAQIRDEHKREFERQKTICRMMQFNFDEFLDMIYGTLTKTFRRS